MTTTTQRAATPAYSQRQKAGFVLASILALWSIPGAFIPTGGSAEADQPGPPLAVLVVGAVLGLIVLGLLLWGWRTGRRGPVRAAAILLALMALSAVPAFFVPGVAAWIRLIAGLNVLGTIAAIVLLFSPAPRPAVTA